MARRRRASFGEPPPLPSLVVNEPASVRRIRSANVNFLSGRGSGSGSVSTRISDWWNPYLTLILSDQNAIFITFRTIVLNTFPDSCNRYMATDKMQGATATATRTLKRSLDELVDGYMYKSMIITRRWAARCRAGSGKGRARARARRRALGSRFWLNCLSCLKEWELSGKHWSA